MNKFIGFILSISIISSYLLMLPFETAYSGDLGGSPFEISIWSETDIIYGDADNDGDVDADDVTYMRKCIVGSIIADERTIEACDFNLDGSIDIGEVILVRIAIANGTEDLLCPGVTSDTLNSGSGGATATPTVTPTATPTATPSATPTATPSATPTATPTVTPDNGSDDGEDDDSEDYVEDDNEDEFYEDDEDYYDEDEYYEDDEDYYDDYYDEDEYYEDDESYYDEDVSANSLTVSDWAEDEVLEALEYGLIPDEMIYEDLTKTISREKFAAIAVKLYEDISGNDAPNMDISDTPFDDCALRDSIYTDYIGSAYKLGIVNGVDDNEFAPDTAISREQLATLLCRVVKKYCIEGWSLNNDYTFDISGVSKFADDEYISDYAKNSVYFMAKYEIVQGIGDSKFAPRNVTEKQKLENYATATKEQAILMALRCYNKFAAISKEL